MAAEACPWWACRQGVSAASPLLCSGAGSYCSTGAWIQECLFPSSYCLYGRSLFGQCFLAFRGRVLQRQIPYLLSPCCIHTLPIPSSKYGFVKLPHSGCGLCRVLRCPSQIKPWLCYSTPCLMEGCFQSIGFDAAAPVYLRGPGMLMQVWCDHQNWFLPRGEFMVSWVIGGRRGACSVVDHFFCLLVMEFLEFLCFSKMEVVRYFFRAVAGGLWMEKLILVANCIALTSIACL